MQFAKKRLSSNRRQEKCFASTYVTLIAFSHGFLENLCLIFYNELPLEQNSVNPKQSPTGIDEGIVGLTIWRLLGGKEGKEV